MMQRLRGSSSCLSSENIENPAAWGIQAEAMKSSVPSKGLRCLIAEGGNHRPSAPFCRELLTPSKFVMRYFVPADGTFLGDDRAAFMTAGLGLAIRENAASRVVFAGFS
jgi:hypothetical protein